MKARLLLVPMPINAADDVEQSMTEQDGEKAAAEEQINTTAEEDGVLFKYFPKLPVETRFQIWSYLEPSPILLIPDVTNNHREPYQHTYYRRVPPLLHISREVREEYLWKEGLKKAHITFKLITGLSYPARERGVYFSPEHDRLMVAFDDPWYPYFSNAVEPEDFRKSPLHNNTDLTHLQYISFARELMPKVDHIIHLIALKNLNSIRLIAREVTYPTSSPGWRFVEHQLWLIDSYEKDARWCLDLLVGDNSALRDVDVKVISWWDKSGWFLGRYWEFGGVSSLFLIIKAMEVRWFIY